MRLAERRELVVIRFLMLWLAHTLGASVRVLVAPRAPASLPYRTAAVPAPEPPPPACPTPLDCGPECPGPEVPQPDWLDRLREWCDS